MRFSPPAARHALHHSVHRPVEQDQFQLGIAFRHRPRPVGAKAGIAPCACGRPSLRWKPAAFADRTTLQVSAKVAKKVSTWSSLMSCLRRARRLGLDFPSSVSSPSASITETRLAIPAPTPPDKRKGRSLPKEPGPKPNSSLCLPVPKQRDDVKRFFFRLFGKILAIDVKSGTFIASCTEARDGSKIGNIPTIVWDFRAPSFRPPRRRSE